jgi:hypothetical protein
MNRNQSQAAAQSQADEYFDLHVKGCGYLSRVREVPVGRRGSESFLACAVSALHGLCNDPSYSYFDLKVAGSEADALVRDLWRDVGANRKVFIAFRAGDVYAEPYEVDERDRETRQPTGRRVLRASIKGRLLQITHAQVDGKVVFSSDPGKRGSDDGTAADAGHLDGGDETDAAGDDQAADRTEGSQEPDVQPGPSQSPRSVTRSTAPGGNVVRDRTRVRSYAEVV